MQTIHAIYKNGVFKPVGRIELPENCEVEFEPRVLSPLPSEPSTKTGADLAGSDLIGI